MEKKEEILRVRNLDISFETTAGVVTAVRGVNYRCTSAMKAPRFAPWTALATA